MFLINSRLGLFSAAFLSSVSINIINVTFTLLRLPFSRSYGVNLPSSLTRVLSSALGYSPHPPVSVSVRILSKLVSEAFLGSMASTQFRFKTTSSLLRFNELPDFPRNSPYKLEPTFLIVGWYSLLRPSSDSNALKVVQEC